MSKHWRPTAKVGGPQRRKLWDRPDAYVASAVRRPSRASLALIIGAVVAGLIGGGLWSLAEPKPAPVTSEAPAVILPDEQVDPADADWERRGAQSSAPDERASRSSAGAGSATRLEFGLCHSGGGTNCVVDGDTFYIGGAKVRIAGIDAPETHPPSCAYEAELGAQATAKLRALLNSGALTMTRIGRDRDSYGRLLRNVQAEGVDVGAAMVGAGVAREYGRGRRGWC